MSTRVPVPNGVESRGDRTRLGKDLKKWAQNPWSRYRKGQFPGDNITSQWGINKVSLEDILLG